MEGDMMGNDKQKRRKLSLDYKRRIVREADAAKYGQLTPLLKREGIYGSQIRAWRLELGRAAAAKATAASEPAAKRKAPAIEPGPGSLRGAMGDGKLERDIAEWERKIEVARKIIEAQRRLRELEAELERG